MELTWINKLRIAAVAAAGHSRDRPVGLAAGRPGRPVVSRASLGRKCFRDHGPARSGVWTRLRRLLHRLAPWPGDRHSGGALRPGGVGGPLRPDARPDASLPAACRAGRRWPLPSASSPSTGCSSWRQGSQASCSPSTCGRPSDGEAADEPVAARTPDAQPPDGPRRSFPYLNGLLAVVATVLLAHFFVGVFAQDVATSRNVTPTQPPIGQILFAVIGRLRRRRVRRQEIRRPQLPLAGHRLGLPNRLRASDLLPCRDRAAVCRDTARHLLSAQRPDDPAGPVRRPGDTRLRPRLLDGRPLRLVAQARECRIIRGPARFFRCPVFFCKSRCHRDLRT